MNVKDPLNAYAGQSGNASLPPRPWCVSRLVNKKKKKERIYRRIESREMSGSLVYN